MQSVLVSRFQVEVLADHHRSDRVRRVLPPLVAGSGVHLFRLQTPVCVRPVPGVRLPRTIPRLRLQRTATDVAQLLMVWLAIKRVPVTCVYTVCGPSFVLTDRKCIPVSVWRSTCQGFQRSPHHVVLYKCHYCRLIPQSIYALVDSSLSWIKPEWIHPSVDSPLRGFIPKGFIP